jgi:hypothetical protein
MITRFFSGEELDLDVPGPVRGKYIGELRREGFMKVLDDIFL